MNKGETLHAKNRADHAPLVSIIMPVCNAGPYVAEAVSSMLEQSMGDFEFLIVDDASDDNSADIVASFDDSRIVLLHNAERMGVAASLNRMLDLARGEFIARMDADDISLPERLAIQVDFMRKHSDIWACGGKDEVFSDSRPLVQIREAYPDHEEIKAVLLFYNPISHPFMIYRGSVWREHGIRYSLDAPYAEDYELWSRLTHHLPGAKMANIQTVLGRWRRRSSSVSAQHKERQLGSALAIQMRNLRALGFSVTDAGLAVHAKFFSRRQPASCVEDLQAVFAWAIRLLEANRERAIYEQAVLKRLLFQQLLWVVERDARFSRQGKELLASWNKA